MLTLPKMPETAWVTGMGCPAVWRALVATREAIMTWMCVLPSLVARGAQKRRNGETRNDEGTQETRGKGTERE